MYRVCFSRLWLWHLFTGSKSYTPTKLMMIRSTLASLLLCVFLASSKPTDKKTRVHEEEQLSNLEHNDKKSFDYDHEAFLGSDVAKTFDQLAPEESRRRLRWVLISWCTSDFNSWQVQGCFALSTLTNFKFSQITDLVVNKRNQCHLISSVIFSVSFSSSLFISAASLWIK